MESRPLEDDSWRETQLQEALAEDEKLRLDAIESLQILFKSFEHQKPVSQSSHYEFDDASVLRTSWLPPVLGAICVSLNAEVRHTSLSFLDDGSKRPGMHIDITLENLEKVYLKQDPSDTRLSTFRLSSSMEDPDDTVLNHEVAYFVSSLVLPANRLPDLHEAHHLSGLTDESHPLDPSDPIIAQYMRLMAPAQAASSQDRLSYLGPAFEDDRFTLLVNKYINSDGSTVLRAEFSQEGSDLSEDDYSMLVMTITETSDHLIPTATLQHVRGRGDQIIDIQQEQSHHYSFMLTVFEKAIELERKKIEFISYEDHRTKIIREEYKDRKAPDERD